MKRRQFFLFGTVANPLILRAQPLESIGASGLRDIRHQSFAQNNQIAQATIPRNTTQISETEQFRADLSSTQRDRGASLITINDAAKNFPDLANRHVEAALAALAARIPGTSLLKFGKPSDAVDALNAAAAALNTGADIQLNSGAWRLNSAWTFRGQRIHLRGAGKNLTTFEFTSTNSNTAITLDNQTAIGVSNSSISRLSFTSADTQTKTAIKLVNVANCEISEISILTDTWRGDSIGIQSTGRQLIDIANCDIKCARPIVFSANPNYPSLAVDHFSIKYSELVSTSASRAVLEFEDGVSLSNTTIQNLACVGGGDGIRWIDTSSKAASFKLSISNFRSEQGRDPEAWSINLESRSQYLQSLTISNALLDRSRNGIRLRNVQRATFIGVDFNQGNGKVALDMIFTPGSRLTMINCWRQSGAVQTLKNAKCVNAESSPGGGYSEEWVFDAGFSTSAAYSDVYHSGTPITIGPGAKIEICDSRFVGFLLCVTDLNGNCIISLSGASTTPQIMSDPGNSFSNTPSHVGSTNIYHQGTKTILENLHKNQLTVSVLRFGFAAGG